MKFECVLCIDLRIVLAEYQRDAPGEVGLQTGLVFAYILSFRILI